MIEKQKERDIIIAFFGRVVQKSTHWHYYKATLSVNASENIELVVSEK